MKIGDLIDRQGPGLGSLTGPQAHDWVVGALFWGKIASFFPEYDFAALMCMSHVENRNADERVY